MKSISEKAYKVLVVNHEEHIHDAINIVLKDMIFLNYKLEIINIYDSQKAKYFLEQNSDIVLTIIDVSMEPLKEGLSLVQYIRETLDNSLSRIIMTGQMNQFIDIRFIKRYDITDFKNRQELSYEHLFATFRASIMQYEYLAQLRYKIADTYKQMTTDSLTHLYNRTKLAEDCHSDINKTLILIDIIGFSRINENYGYETGDMVLKEFAAFLYSMYHEEFNVYHLDSDLFALVLMSDETGDIFKVVEDIKDDILKLNIITNNFNQTLDISIGVAYQSEENVLRKAELALREARSLGLNKIKYYSEDLKVLKKLKSINYWGPIVKEALENSKIIVNYQPIYDLKTDKIDKYELLMRLEHNGKIHLPAKFLDAAYHTRQTYDIFKIMFMKACTQAQKTGMKFSVNIGDSELGDDEIVEFITNAMATCSIDPALISLEILEYHAISNDAVIKDKIMKIHDLGIKIAIDDFGVNCSNFGQMQNLPIDIIKIDGSFIKNITESKNSQIVVKTIQAFAKEKGIKLVAEYVCSEDVLESVKGLNIEYGQGNYLCEPLDRIKKSLI